MANNFVLNDRYQIYYLKMFVESSYQILVHFMYEKRAFTKHNIKTKENTLKFGVVFVNCDIHIFST